MGFSRREVVQTIGVGSIAVGAASPGTAAQQDSWNQHTSEIGRDWPMFAVNPGNNMYLPGLDGPQSELELKWKFTDMEKEGNHTPHEPVVANDTVYFGDGGQYVYAVDLASGTLKWRQNLDIGIANSPAIGDERVFVVTSDGRVYGFPFGDDPSPTFIGRFSDQNGVQVQTSPTVSDGVLVCAAEGVLAAFDVDEQTNRWRQDSVRTVYRSTTVNFAIGNETVVFVTADRTCQAVDLHSGELKWEVSTESDGEFIPVLTLEGDTVYVVSNTLGVGDEADSCGIHALDVATGATRWSHTYSVSARPSPIVTDQYVFFGGRGQYTLDGEELSEPSSWPLAHTRATDGNYMYSFSGIPTVETVYLTVEQIQDDGWPTVLNAPIDKPANAQLTKPVFLHNGLLFGVAGTLQLYGTVEGTVGVPETPTATPTAIDSGTDEEEPTDREPVTAAESDESGSNQFNVLTWITGGLWYLWVLLLLLLAALGGLIKYLTDADDESDR